MKKKYQLGVLNCVEDTKTHAVTVTMEFKNSHIIGADSVGYAVVNLDSHKKLDHSPKAVAKRFKKQYGNEIVTLRHGMIE